LEVASNSVVIRPETTADRDSIREVVSAAFSSSVQADLVDVIRLSAAYVPGWSLVAVVDGRVVGHVMVSLATLRDGADERAVANLSPLSVHPDHQHRGVGAALVRDVVAVVDASGEPLLVLEGDPAYYSRFGFEPSAPNGIRIQLPEWAAPEAAQVLRLGAYDASWRGDVVYPPAFDDLGH
jgi:putative acetyltransferase